MELNFLLAAELARTAQRQQFEYNDEPREHRVTRRGARGKPKRRWLR
jgi:hypothetical protein